MHSAEVCLQIYKERKNLAYTLQDARGVVSKLELIMGVMMHVLFVFFYLIIFDVGSFTATALIRLACEALHAGLSRCMLACVIAPMLLLDTAASGFLHSA